jgi:hypothetical protein
VTLISLYSRHSLFCIPQGCPCELEEYGPIESTTLTPVSPPPPFTVSLKVGLAKNKNVAL